VSAPHRPGRPPWPERGHPGATGDTAPIRPRANEPLQFHSEALPPPGNQVLVWVLRGLGLVAVAVISGLVWWYINDDGAPPPALEETTEQQAGGQFEFAPIDQVKDPRHDSNCADHSYDDVQAFFRKTPCEQLTRALYTTTDAEGRTVYTNVSVVRMPTAENAAQLRELADSDGTGNVTDLVKAGVVKVPSLPDVNGGGYAAVQHDRNVIIVESALDPAAKKGAKADDEAVLDAICQDAIRLGDEIS
jgi:hypothetical protein